MIERTDRPELSAPKAPGPGPASGSSAVKIPSSASHLGGFSSMKHSPDTRERDFDYMPSRSVPLPKSAARAVVDDWDSFFSDVKSEWSPWKAQPVWSASVLSDYQFYRPSAPDSTSTATPPTVSSGPTPTAPSSMPESSLFAKKPARGAASPALPIPKEFKWSLLDDPEYTGPRSGSYGGSSSVPSSAYLPIAPRGGTSSSLGSYSGSKSFDEMDLYDAEVTGADSGDPDKDNPLLSSVVGFLVSPTAGGPTVASAPIVPASRTSGSMDDLMFFDEYPSASDERTDSTPDRDRGIPSIAGSITDGIDPATLGRKLFVGRIPKDLTPEFAMEFFKKFGDVEAVDVNADRGCCFVTFSDAKTVEEVLEGKNVKYIAMPPTGVDICLRRYVHIEKDKVFVRGLTPEATREDIFKYFKQFGKITSITLHLNKAGSHPFAFVRFAKPKSVNQIMARNDHMICGKPVHCLRAHKQGGKSE